jgi:hypothetical protein
VSSWLTAILDSTIDLVWSVDLKRFALLTWNRALFDQSADAIFLNGLDSEAGSRVVQGKREALRTSVRNLGHRQRHLHRRLPGADGQQGLRKSGGPQAS